MVIIDAARFEALIFDLDGVITQTASIHARAWKQIFDEFLARQAEQTHKAFVPFDLETDYRRYVDGKPRIAGALSFLAARGIEVPMGEPGDEADQWTAQGLAGRKDQYFTALVEREGVEVFAPAVALLREAREHGMRLAVASSSHHCADILRAAHLTEFFDARVDGVDIDRLDLKGKPAPDMFLEAARRLGVAPSRAAVFEDATAGVAAAHSGGFGLAVGVGSGPHAAALLESGADQVVANLGEVSLQGNRRGSAEATRPARIFVGIKIADDLAEELASFARPLRPHDVRLVPSNDIHLTLVPPWDEPEIAGAVATLQAAITGFNPFVLTFTRLGYGPNLREPRLLWTECAAGDELSGLRMALLAAYGKSDSRPFVPHVTLARLSRNGRTIVRRNPINRVLHLTQFVASVELFQSPPQGKRGYEVLASLPLGRKADVKSME